MSHAKFLLAAAAIAFASTAAQAASSASSAASDSLTTSSGSVSDSFGTSSKSSSKTATAANGDYKIVAIAAAPGREGTLRLTLQTVAAQHAAPDEFYLYLPQATVMQAGLAQGGIVSARPRPYGTEFSQGTGEAKQAFYLVLTDDWLRDLRTQAVQL